MRIFIALVGLWTLAAAGLAADTATVVANSANVRAGAGTTHAVVGTLARGTSVEILETSGDWIRVRAASVEGWVSARLVQRAAAAAPPPETTRPPASADANPARVTIDHREVSCLVAEEFVRVDACLTPAGKVARTQVHFRASETSPWYSVDMRPEGSCMSAVLPKPKSSTRQVQYFIYALDREFAESARPEGAPGSAYRPRVVASKGDCGDNTMLGSIGGGARQVVVSIARSPAGKILEGGASVLGSPAQVAGFSADGIVAGVQPPAAQSASASSGSSTAAGAAAAGGATAAAAGGIGTPVIVAGAVGGAAIVGGLVVATGGGDSPEEVSLTGSWSGNVASGKGLSFSFTVDGDTCSFRYDTQLTLTQTGTAIAGPANFVLRDARCNFPEVDAILASLLGQASGGGLTGTVTPPSGIRFDFGEGFILSGGYTATTIDVSGRPNFEDVVYDMTLSVAKNR